MKQMLMKPVLPEEIKKVLFAMLGNKSHGPDGYSSEFYKAVWSIISFDFIIVIQLFFHNSFLPKESTLPFFP